MRTDRGTLVAFAVSVLLGGVNFVAVRFSNRELPPFEGAALRFGIAALLFLGYALARGIPLPRGRALVGAIAFGLLAFGGAYAFGYWGLVTAPAAVGALAFALVPLGARWQRSAWASCSATSSAPRSVRARSSRCSRERRAPRNPASS
ncbi:MAG: hypothetical protein AUG02_06700 [Chloroflexi bacterium 13_1_20CM_2_70_9]|nr:MAG: hypothetical protein AUG02_06700 [Chloroflexi bacterium 13_1_20CM_2_70_9]